MSSFPNKSPFLKCFSRLRPCEPFDEQPALHLKNILFLFQSYCSDSFYKCIVQKMAKSWTIICLNVCHFMIHITKCRRENCYFYFVIDCLWCIIPFSVQQLSNGFMWIDAALNILKETCFVHLTINTDLWVLVDGVRVPPPDLVGSLCVNDCTEQGSCIDGKDHKYL